VYLLWVLMRFILCICNRPKTTAAADFEFSDFRYKDTRCVL